MSQNSSNSTRQKSSKNSALVEKCYVCQHVLKPGALFCEYCAPPTEPEEVPEYGLRPFQTGWRVLVLVALFASFVILKLETNLPFMESEAPPSSILPPQEGPPPDPDFRVVHFVNVFRANVRESPKGGTRIVMVLKKGEIVPVLETKGKWTRISAHGKTGWIGSRLLNSRVE